MNEQLKAAFLDTIESAATAETLDSAVADMPERYRADLSEQIDTKRASFATPAASAPVNLDGITSAELVQLLADRPELKDSLATLFAPVPDPATEEGAQTTEIEDEDKDKEEEEPEAPEPVVPPVDPAPEVDPPAPADALEDATLVFTDAEGADLTFTGRLVLGDVDLTDHVSNTISELGRLQSQQDSNFASLRDMAVRLGVDSDVLDAEDLDISKLVLACASCAETIDTKRAGNMLAHNTANDSGPVTGSALRRLY